MSIIAKKKEIQDVEWDNGIDAVLPNWDGKLEEKVVIFDGDSLAYFAFWSGYDENGNKNPEYTKENGGYETAEGILVEKILSILTEIEKYFTISHLYMCVKGKDNFRHKLYDQYKAKRPPSPPIIAHLINYLVENYNAVVADGCESDDVVFSISQMINHQGIILSIDKDLKQIPTIIYDYQKNLWHKVTEEDAIYNFAIQMCIGDASDGINFTPNFGIKKAEKLIQKGMTKFQYIKRIYDLYKKIHGDKARETIKLAYNLLKLHNLDNLPIK